MRLVRLAGLTSFLLLALSVPASATLAPVVVKESGVAVPVGTPVEAVVSVDVQAPIHAECRQILKGTLTSNNRTKDLATLVPGGELAGECSGFRHSTGTRPTFRVAHGKEGLPNTIGVYGTATTWTFNPTVECSYFIGGNTGTIAFPSALEWGTVVQDESWPRKPICPTLTVATRGVLIDPSRPLSENLVAELG